MNNWDFSLMKDTRITERLTTQFRAEFFNGWNHEQFSSPDATLVPGSSELSAVVWRGLGPYSSV